MLLGLRNPGCSHLTYAKRTELYREVSLSIVQKGSRAKYLNSRLLCLFHSPLSLSSSNIALAPSPMQGIKMFCLEVSGLDKHGQGSRGSCVQHVWMLAMRALTWRLVSKGVRYRHVHFHCAEHHVETNQIMILGMKYSTNNVINI